MSVSRKRQLEIIASGESVIVGKKVYSAKNVKDLPSEADQAKGDPEREAAARESLEADKQKAEAELAKLSSSKKAAESDPTTGGSGGGGGKSEAAKSSAKSEAKSDSK